MKCFDTKYGDFEVEQVRVTTGGGDIFFRRRISRNDDGSISAVSAEMEVITQCQEVRNERVLDVELVVNEAGGEFLTL